MTSTQVAEHMVYHEPIQILKTTAALDTLPYDIILLITQFLGIQDVISLSRVRDSTHDIVLHFRSSDVVLQNPA